MEPITFTVFGHAETAGSKRSFVLMDKKTGQPRTRPNGSIIVNTVDDNPKGRSWKESVARAALEARLGEADLLTGALRVTMRFYRPRPQSHYGKSGLNAQGKASIAPATRPDVLKLARCAEDALSGIAFADDAQIVEEHLFKFWDEPARLEVEIEQLQMTVTDAAREPFLFDADTQPDSQKIASGF